MASVSGFGKSVYIGATWANTYSFVKDIRMSSWLLYDMFQWLSKIQPLSTRNWIDLTKASGIAEGVDDFGNGPYELTIHFTRLVLGKDDKGKPVNRFYESLAVISSTINALKLLQKFEAIDLGKRVNALSGIGIMASLVKTGNEVGDHIQKFRKLRNEIPNQARNEGTENGTVEVTNQPDTPAIDKEKAIYREFIHIVNNVSYFALKTLSLTALVFNKTASPNKMLTLSSIMLTGFMINHYLDPERTLDDVADQT